jgi:hypothetical protein
MQSIIDMNMNKNKNKSFDLEDTNNFPSLSLGVTLKKTVKVVTPEENHVDNTVDDKPVFNREKRKPCNTILSGEICSYGGRCSFAHSIEELTSLECGSGDRCYKVKIGSKGLYFNNGSSVCGRRHPGESNVNFHKRIGTTKLYPSLPEVTPVFSAKCTKMCNSFTLREACKVENCQYAHAFDELVVLPCNFGDKCIHVERIEECVYKNIDAGIKVCPRFHVGESKESVYERRKAEPIKTKKDEVTSCVKEEHVELKKPLVPVENVCDKYFPEGVSIETNNMGVTHIKAPKSVITSLLDLALRKGSKNIKLSPY